MKQVNTMKEYEEVQNYYWCDEYRNVYTFKNGKTLIIPRNNGEVELELKTKEKSKFNVDKIIETMLNYV